ncbi:uncharacterized protein [Epargyreus clarus]|uniref:uncharacterized protein n=1 Tax=Epargyreus clarus TaxID=520877 RepID=UPI003C304A94
MSDRDRIGIEPRGKKKKIALFVYFADIILKKIFIFKLIYAFIFWLVIHKAGYFLTWFISYLKEQKRDHDHYVPHYDHGPSYGPHYDHGPSYEPHYDHGPGYGPYRRESHGI